MVSRIVAGSLSYDRVPLRQVPGLTCWCLTTGFLPEFRVNWVNGLDLISVSGSMSDIQG
jgi:hypothetical protein